MPNEAQATAIAIYRCHILDGWMEGWKDGRMEGWKDGRMEGWKDRRIEG